MSKGFLTKTVMKRIAVGRPQPAGQAPGPDLGDVVRARLPKRGWAPAGAVGSGVLIAALLLGFFSHRYGLSYFPRDPSEFLSPHELERRLDQASQQLKADPGDMHALVESGIVHFQMGKQFYPDAINELEEAWRLGAMDPRVFYYLGAMYQEEGLPQFAITEYQRFLRNRPDDREVHLLLAKLLYQTERYEEALGFYQWFAQRYSQDPVVLENTGFCLLKLHRNDEAAQVFRGLLTQPGLQGRRAAFYLGQLAFDAQKYSEAKDDFSRVLPVENDELGIAPALVHAALAANFEKLELWEDAKTQWEDVLRFDPRNSQAKSGLRSAKSAIKKAAKLVANKDQE